MAVSQTVFAFDELDGVEGYWLVYWKIPLHWKVYRYISNEQTGIMASGEEDHRSKVPFHCVMSRVPTIDTTNHFNVDLITWLR